MLPDAEEAGADDAGADTAAAGAELLLAAALESEAGLLAESDDFPSEPPLLSLLDLGFALP